MQKRACQDGLGEENGMKSREIEYLYNIIIGVN